MQTFNEWLNEAYVDPRMAIKDTLQSHSSKVDEIKIDLKSSDNPKCKTFIMEHNTICRGVQSECKYGMSEIDSVGDSFIKATIEKTINELKKLLVRAEENHSLSRMPGGCGITGRFYGKLETAADKIEELPRLIRGLISSLKGINFTPKLTPTVTKEPEESGIYGKLFGKKGWLNPDAYAKPVKRPEKKGYPKL